MYGAVDAAAMGRFRACDGCATSLAWTGDVRLGESPGGESPGGGFALVVGDSDGSVRTFTASRESLLAAANTDGRRGRRAARAVPLEPGAELSPADGDPVTRIAVLQMNSGIDPEENLATILAGISSAAAGGATMLFTPEMSLLLDRDRKRAAQHVLGKAGLPVMPVGRREPHRRPGSLGPRLDVRHRIR